MCAVELGFFEVPRESCYGTFEAQASLDWRVFFPASTNLYYLVRQFSWIYHICLVQFEWCYVGPSIRLSLLQCLKFGTDIVAGFHVMNFLWCGTSALVCI